MKTTCSLFAPLLLGLLVAGCNNPNMPHSTNNASEVGSQTWINRSLVPWYPDSISVTSTYLVTRIGTLSVIPDTSENSIINSNQGWRLTCYTLFNHGHDKIYWFLNRTEDTIEPETGDVFTKK